MTTRYQCTCQVYEIMQLVGYLGWIFTEVRTKNKGNNPENSTRPLRIFQQPGWLTQHHDQIDRR